MQVEQAKRLKALEKENVRLKRLVAEKELDIQILKEAIAYESKNFSARLRDGKQLIISAKNCQFLSVGHVWF